MEKKSPDAFRTISEVAEWLGVPAHVLRFWESRFGQVKPVKRAGGRRYYRPSDMELLGGIRKLLHEDGLTIRGVQKLLRENGVKYVAAMSPPIDQPVSLKDVSPNGPDGVDAARLERSDESAPEHAPANAPDDAPTEAPTEAPAEAPTEATTEAPTSARTASSTEPGRPAPVFDPTAEDAVEIAATPDPAAAPAAATPDPGAGDGTPEPASAETAAGPPPAVTPDQPAPLAAEESAQADGTGTGTDETAPAVDEDTRSAPAEPGEDSPLDGPDAIEFFAHEAQPETGEPDAVAHEVLAGRGEGGPAAVDSAPGGPAAAATTSDESVRPGDEPPRSSEDMATAPRPEPPEAPEAPAAPETVVETAGITAGPDASAAPGPAEAPEEPETSAPDTAAPGAESTQPTEPTDAGGRAPAFEGRERVPPPAAEDRLAASHAPMAADLIMPAIGADPEDDDARATPAAVAAALRRVRFRAMVAGPDAVPHPAQLRAYADRLEALSGRLGSSPGGRRPF